LGLVEQDEYHNSVLPITPEILVILKLKSQTKMGFLEQQQLLNSGEF
jgi:hypothetical protein